MCIKEISCLKQPDKFDDAQRTRCLSGCRYLSDKKIWCCKWGVDIRGERSRVITPKQKSIAPLPTRKADPAADYVRAAQRLIAMGAPVIDQAEYIKRREICSRCRPTVRCQYRCSSAWIKIANALAICLEGKW